MRVAPVGRVRVRGHVGPPPHRRPRPRRGLRRPPRDRDRAGDAVPHVVADLAARARRGQPPDPRPARERQLRRLHLLRGRRVPLHPQPADPRGVAAGPPPRGPGGAPLPPPDAGRARRCSGSLFALAALEPTDTYEGLRLATRRSRSSPTPGTGTSRTTRSSPAPTSGTSGTSRSTCRPSCRDGPGLPLRSRPVAPVATLGGLLLVLTWWRMHVTETEPVIKRSCAPTPAWTPCRWRAPRRAALLPQARCRAATLRGGAPLSLAALVPLVWFCVGRRVVPPAGASR